MKEKAHTISGFSKLSKNEKIEWLVESYFDDSNEAKKEFEAHWHPDENQQKILDGFSENTISNFPLPFGVAPNFLINGKTYCLPMVIEESSVVAAASSAAKYWFSRGGFKAEIISTKKLGHVHFCWNGEASKWPKLKDKLEKTLRSCSSDITANMEKRGGGIEHIELLDQTALMDAYYQIKVSFETCDSMGANFINSVLERFASCLKAFVAEEPSFTNEEKEVEIIMSILSNYTPDCLVRVSVECPIEDLKLKNEEDARLLANKFCKAVQIAKIDPYRATTHNKGIFNGIDAIALATGNDFRSIEACGHTYACRDGQYRSLSDCKIDNGIFSFWMEIPLAVGTVGGLTKVHPIAKRSLELLGNPNSKELMMIIAAGGLAQNFAALRSLVTTGIQKGHMKMHLSNILNQLQASDKEIKEAIIYFKDKVVSHSAVREFLDLFRSKTQGKPAF